MVSKQTMELRQIRIRLGWCQSQMASRLGLSREEVDHMERGQSPIPEKVLAILQQLELSSTLAHLDLNRQDEDELSSNS